MRYNLKYITKYNYNFQELKNISKTNADILLALYLSLNYKKELINLENAVKELALDEYPTLDWKLYTLKVYQEKVRFSNFVCLNPNSRIKYLDILQSSIPDKDKVAYIEYVSLCPSYSNEKFVPCSKFKVPRMLSLHGLVKATEGGIILVKERG